MKLRVYGVSLPTDACARPPFAQPAFPFLCTKPELCVFLCLVFSYVDFFHLLKCSELKKSSIKMKHKYFLSYCVIKNSRPHSLKLLGTHPKETFPPLGLGCLNTEEADLLSLSRQDPYMWRGAEVSKDWEIENKVEK